MQSFFLPFFVFESKQQSSFNRLGDVL